MEKNFVFEMKYVGDCRGYYFNGVSDWEDNDLIKGLSRVRIMGDEIEGSDMELFGMNREVEKLNSVKEVVDWLESDCIGVGEECLVELKVNGVVVMRDEMGMWMFENCEFNDWNYLDKVEEEFGKEVFDEYMCEADRVKYWNLGLLEDLNK